MNDRLIRNDVGLPKGGPSILTTVIGNSGTALNGPPVKREAVVTFYFVVKGIENSRGFVNGTFARGALPITIASAIPEKSASAACCENTDSIAASV